MTLFAKECIKIISIESIDLKDDFYKVSKNRFDENLKKSIETLGIIEPPVLIKKDEIYKIIFGHNRLYILNEMNVESVDSIVIENIDSELYLKQVFLKNFRGEIGPISKIKLIQILKKIFNFDNGALSFAAKNINLPMQFLQTPQLSESAIKLPAMLKDYIDCKDIGFKVIKNLLCLPLVALNLLDEWVSITNMRANIFKKMVDYLADINRRDGISSQFEKLDYGSIKDRRAKEDYLYYEVFRLRYPEYSELRESAQNIINRIRTTGVNIIFPEYFESDEIDIHFKINRRDGIESFRSEIEALNTQDLIELLELL